MIHDQDLLDRLSTLAVERFDGEVFRATGVNASPLAFSVNGGRWAPPARDGTDVPVLYTSLERNGALAEVVSYLRLLTPLPSRPLKVSRLGVSTAKTLRLARAGLEWLDVDIAQYGVRDYARTQSIGAALAFLGLDGLIAPSARWPCDNLMIYQSNRLLNERLEVIEEENVDWQAWARANGLLKVAVVETAAANPTTTVSSSPVAARGHLSRSHRPGSSTVVHHIGWSHLSGSPSEH